MKEVWKPIKGFEGKYEVSNLGRIKSLACKSWNGKVWWNKPEKILKHCKTRWGYPIIPLKNDKTGKRKQYHIHVLVAIAFLGHKPDGTNKICVDHINFIRDDNCVKNLQLLTNRENSSKREKRGSSKYTGVHWVTKSKHWAAAIRINGKKKYLGSFSDEKDASLAYQRELKKL